MNNSRKQCINVPTATYSGKEMSPLRYGISAEEFDTGTVKTGHDGLNWIVKMKNNRKVWVRIYIPCNKMVHEIHKINKTSISEDITDKNKTNNDDKASTDSNDSKNSNASKDSNDSNDSNDSKDSNDSNETDNKKTLDDDEIDEEQPMIKEIKKETKNDKNSKTGEKKLTNYNIFLAYRLNKLKEEYSKTSENKTKKEIFAEVLSEWKNIDKTSQEFKNIMIEAEEFKNNK
jgi:hypothetical protein